MEWQAMCFVPDPKHHPQERGECGDDGQDVKEIRERWFVHHGYTSLAFVTNVSGFTIAVLFCGSTGTVFQPRTYSMPCSAGRLAQGHSRPERRGQCGRQLRASRCRE